uniref:Papilin n=1 Tax=Clytia hemisphaerica TaxID=252671 RepID=A0A7M5VFX9_9CNID
MKGCVIFGLVLVAYVLGETIIEDGCGPKSPFAPCNRDFCEEAQCPNHPLAECRLNICGTCKAVFYVNDREVDCHGDSGSVVNPGSGALGGPEIPRTTLATLKFEDRCQPGVGIVPCTKNPCLKARCEGQRGAECRVNLCGQCSAVFYVNNQKVTCENAIDRSSLTRCQYDRHIDLRNRHKDNFIVDCNANGQYKPLQCWNSVGLCWCVRPEDGTEIFGSRTYFPNKPRCDVIVNDCHNKKFGCCQDGVTSAQGSSFEGCPDTAKQCEDTEFGCCQDLKTPAQGPNGKGCPRQASKCEILQQRASTGFIGAFTPQCDSKGQFEKIQCWNAIGHCWCVDNDGRELEGTRAEGQQPDCTAVVCEDKRDDCRKYASVPGFCQRISHYMKEYCRKSCGFCNGVVNPEKYIAERPGCNSPFGCCDDYISSSKGPNDYMCPLYKTSCDMPKVSGNCEGNFQRYYYDQLTNECKLFVYGGCRGNKNNYISQGKCEQECVQEIQPTEAPLSTTPAITFQPKITTDPKDITDPCEMPLQRGTCDSGSVTADQRYYFDKVNGQCQVFAFGGCDSNENNFLSKSECENMCIYRKVTTPSINEVTDGLGGPSLKEGCGHAYGCCEDGVTPSLGPDFEGCPVYESYCMMPAATGPCREYLPRYYYNHETGQCELFVYGGCGGNNNRFYTPQECYRDCYLHQQGKTNPPTKSTSTKRQSTTQQFVTSTPQPTTEQSTMQTDSLQTTIESTVAPKTTLSPTDDVVTTVSTTTTKTRQPTTTTTTTTPGTTTTKKPLTECQRRRIVSSNINRDPNNSKVYMPKCTYNGQFEKVQCFNDVKKCWCVDVDGNEIEGTRGTEYPACPKRPVDQYKSNCQDKQPVKCLEYASPGYCKRYKSFMGTMCPKSCGFCTDTPVVARPGCKSDLGCCRDGITPKQNGVLCPKFKSICEMPKNTGQCFGYMIRYYFNVETQKCEQFAYGGCDGNSNNFFTLVECQQRCGKFATTVASITKTSTTTTTLKPTTEEIRQTTIVTEGLETDEPEVATARPQPTEEVAKTTESTERSTTESLSTKTSSPVDRVITSEQSTESVRSTVATEDLQTTEQKRQTEITTQMPQTEYVSTTQETRTDDLITKDLITDPIRTEEERTTESYTTHDVDKLAVVTTQATPTTQQQQTTVDDVDQRRVSTTEDLYVLSTQQTEGPDAKVVTDFRTEQSTTQEPDFKTTEQVLTTAAQTTTDSPKSTLPKPSEGPHTPLVITEGSTSERTTDSPTDEITTDSESEQTTTKDKIETDAPQLTTTSSPEVSTESKQTTDFVEGSISTTTQQQTTKNIQTESPKSTSLPTKQDSTQKPITMKAKSTTGQPAVTGDLEERTEASTTQETVTASVTSTTQKQGKVSTQPLEQVSTNEATKTQQTGSVSTQEPKTQQTEAATTPLPERDSTTEEVLTQQTESATTQQAQTEIVSTQEPATQQTDSVTPQVQTEEQRTDSTTPLPERTTTQEPSTEQTEAALTDSGIQQTDLVTTQKPSTQQTDVVTQQTDSTTEEPVTQQTEIVTTEQVETDVVPTKQTNTVVTQQQTETVTTQQPQTEQTESATTQEIVTDAPQVVTTQEKELSTEKYTTQQTEEIITQQPGSATKGTDSPKTTEEPATQQTDLVTTQEPATKQTDSVTTQEPATKQTDSVTTQEPATKQTDSVTTQKPATQQTDSVTTQELATQQTDYVTTQEPATQQTDSVTTQEPATKRTDSVTTQGPATQQTDSVTTQQPVTQQTDSVTTQEPATKQTDLVTTQEPATKQTDSVTTHKSLQTKQTDSQHKSLQLNKLIQSQHNNL